MASRTSSGLHVLPTVWLIRAAFGVVVVGFVAANLIAFTGMRAAEATDALLIDNMLASIELVSRIARDVDQKRFAVDAHVMATAPQEMALLDQRIAAVDADFAAAAQRYEPIATLEGEADVWGELKLQISRIGAPIARVLELSRVNRDAEARAEMEQLRDSFDDINRAADRLVRLNREAASAAASRVKREQHTATVVLAAITAPGVLLAIAAMFLVTRMVQRRNRQLQHAWEDLEGRNRELDAFAARVAHDLRGPLTAVDMSAQRLAAKQPAETGSFGVLRRGVAQMDQLIDDLLSLSRAGAETTAGPASTAEVAALLEGDVRPRVDAVGGRLQVDLEPATVRCSPGLLRQVLWNLAENAVKYRRAEVALALVLNGRHVGRRYVLSVADNGSGMTPDEARKAFEPFFRSERVRDTPGTGLGLSIVKRIVDASGGHITLASQPGQGSTFTIVLALDSDG